MATGTYDGQAGTRGAPLPHVGRADIHLHTDVVDGLQSVAQLLDYAEEQTDLDLVAITDHDEIRGALAAHDLAERRASRVRVITGTEVTTRHGHLLALFVDRTFPMLKSVDATLAAIHAAGGIAIVPHPLSWLTTSMGERTLRRIHALGAAARRSGVYFDAIEMLNPSVAGRVACRRARELNRTVLHLPVMAGSDAHASNLIGSAYTTFPGRTPEDLRAAFAAHTTRAHGRFWTFNEHREIAGASLYKAWVLVPARKARQVVGRTAVGVVLEPPSPDCRVVAFREASSAPREGGSSTAPTAGGDR
ncbi:MAG: PHP domain-containing protein [Chloroflexota bacterium]|nr:PHP domain-containing protein [Chloroflexota bacterium]